MTNINTYLEQLDGKKKEALSTLIRKRASNWACGGKELKHFYPEFNGMVWSTETPTGSIECIAYSGRRTKHDFYLRFKDASEFNNYVEKWASRKIEEIELEKARKKAQKELESRLGELVSVGDVFRSSWGYEQTNICYYQLVELRGKKTGVFREIASDTVEVRRGDQGEKVPSLNDFIGEPFKKQITATKGGKQDKASIYINVNSVETAFIKNRNEDGTFEPDYYSWSY